MPDTDDYQARLDREWGTYIAKSYISHDGVLIAKPGDAIPVTNVEAHGYVEQGLVVKVGTKAAEAVVVSPTGDLEPPRTSPTPIPTASEKKG